jgi:hypothetical protein
VIATPEPFLAAFEDWFEREVPETSFWDFSVYEIALKAFRAGYAVALPDDQRPLAHAIKGQPDNDPD